jgi:V8-like Glu-specific endopeptidase
MSELTGQQIAALREGLQKGFPGTMQLTMFLTEQLEKPLAHYAGPTDPLPAAIFRVIEAAQAEGWLNALVLAAYRTRPNQSLIVKVAGELGLLVFSGSVANERPLAGGTPNVSAVAEFEAIVNPQRRMIDPADLRKILVDYPSRICRIEIGGGGGTGFLVGPDLVLTNHHVMEPVLSQRARAQDVICRFDYRKKDDGAPIGQGLECRLANADWCLSYSRSSLWDLRLDGPGPADNELDYCLLRLAGRVGEASLGGSGDTTAPARGWLTMNPYQSVGEKGQQLFVLGHPQGKVLKLSIGDHLGSNGAGTRFRYDANTEPGSSGSPVFNAHLELIGMHNSGWTGASALAADHKANQGIPISNIAALLKASGIALPAA